MERSKIQKKNHDLQYLQLNIEMKIWNWNITYISTSKMVIWCPPTKQNNLVCEVNFVNTSPFNIKTFVLDTIVSFVGKKTWG
jgi:hypothetical protein